MVCVHDKTAMHARSGSPPDGRSSNVDTLQSGHWFLLVSWLGSALGGDLAFPVVHHKPLIPTQWTSLPVHST